MLGAACASCDEKARVAAKARAREQRRERARETAVARGIALREEEATEIEEAIQRSKQECQGLLALSEDDMIAVALARSRDDEEARQAKVQLDAALRWKSGVFFFLLHCAKGPLLLQTEPRRFVDQPGSSATRLGFFVDTARVKA